jgi:hypothetical protein
MEQPRRDSRRDGAGSCEGVSRLMFTRLREWLDDLGYTRTGVTVARDARKPARRYEAGGYRPTGNGDAPRGPIPDMSSSVQPPSSGIVPRSTLNIPMPPGVKPPRRDRGRVDRWTV